MYVHQDIKMGKQTGEKISRERKKHDCGFNIIYEMIYVIYTIY